MLLTVQDVMNYLLAPVTPIPNTVDTLKSGDPDTEVKGIATTFVATHAVIERAVAKGVNLLITHEPTFYNHEDKTDILQGDPVYLDKLKLIQESGIAIFRFHDHQHCYQPDMIVQGLIKDLKWESYIQGELPFPNPSLCVIPKATVKEIAVYVKEKLNIPFVRIVGDLSMPCSRVGLMPGYGGEEAMAIPYYQETNLDLVITGEGAEWETPEYIRDATVQGKKRALIVLGHLKSEEPGMRYLARQLKTTYSSIPVHFIEEKQPFHLV